MKEPEITQEDLLYGAVFVSAAVNVDTHELYKGYDPAGYVKLIKAQLAESIARQLLESGRLSLVNTWEDARTFSTVYQVTVAVLPPDIIKKIKRPNAKANT